MLQKEEQKGIKGNRERPKHSELGLSEIHEEMERKRIQGEATGDFKGVQSFNGALDGFREGLLKIKWVQRMFQ